MLLERVLRTTDQDGSDFWIRLLWDYRSVLAFGTSASDRDTPSKSICFGPSLRAEEH